MSLIAMRRFRLTPFAFEPPPVNYVAIPETPIRITS